MIAVDRHSSLPCEMGHRAFLHALAACSLADGPRGNHLHRLPPPIPYVGL